MIELKFTGESAEEVLQQLAVFAGNAASVSTETPADSTSRKKTPVTKTEDVKKDEPASGGYVLEDLQKLGSEIEDKPQIKKLITTFNQEDGKPCERMSQIQPKDYMPFAGGLKLIIDNQL